MIIKSHIRGGFRSAADYLKEQGQNEFTRIVEISDPHAKNLDEAFRAMWALAEGTRAKKPLHHVSINPMKDERLTDKQVLRICERLEEKYGYAKGDHQRVIVEHIKDGRQHFHVVWNRVSLSTGRPIYPYMHKKQSKIAAREMEVELGLKKPVSCHRAPIHSFRKPLRVRGSKSHNFRSNVRSFAGQPFPTFKIQPVYRTSRVQKEKMPQPLAPIRPVSTGNRSGMSAAQLADYIAACEGRITWAQYFKKWGGNTLAL